MTDSTRRFAIGAMIVILILTLALRIREGERSEEGGNSPFPAGNTPFPPGPGSPP